ncbi:MAG: DUF1223 domain-containing protein [Ginsengibacter sp.]
MKKIYLSIAFITLAAVIFITVGFMTENKTEVAKMENVPLGKGFAVVELFTSEGCSSCPSADETVARLLNKNLDNVYILAYHVDYWNRLGWKDPFSKAEYSQRQSQYASKFNLSSVYTPQVVVNGLSEFVGSDEAKLNEVIKTNLNKQSANSVTISTQRINNSVKVHYEVKGSEGTILNFALVQAEANISVKRGENGGRTLHQVNIVRALKTIDADGKGDIMMDVPNEINNVPLQIIAFTQSKKSFQILGADKKSI